MVLHADTLKQLVQLRYLSLKSLQLLDEPSEMLVIANDQKEGEEEEEEEQVMLVAGGNNSRRLVYLKEEVQEEILPYEEFKKMKQQLWDGFTALKRLEYLGIIDCQLPEAFTSGHSAAFSTLSNLKELVIRSSQLRVRLETGPGELKTLVALSLADNQLLDLEPGDLQGMDKLQFLDLSTNLLTRLMDNSFPLLPQLETLDLTNNPLEAIFKNAFVNVTSIHRLLLLMTPNNSVAIRPGSFIGLNQIQELRLGPAHPADDNGLTPEQFADLAALTELTLRGRWSTIEALAFAANRRLQSLDLKWCAIRRISVDAFSYLPKLRSLDLSNNELNQLPPGVFDQLISLKELWLQDNQLVTLPVDIFHSLTTATKLIRLERNPWHCTCALKDWESTRVNKIKHLDMSNNRTFYQYDKRVTPICATPPHLKGLGVFDATRKQLRCDKMRQTLLPEWNEPQEEVDHGPEATSDEKVDQSALPEAMALISLPADPEYNLEADIIDHGEEIIEDSPEAPAATSSVQPPALVVVSAVDNNLPDDLDGLGNNNFPSSSSSSLSKKALKLRQQTQMLKKSN